MGGGDASAPVPMGSRENLEFASIIWGEHFSVVDDSQFVGGHLAFTKTTTERHTAVTCPNK